MKAFCDLLLDVIILKIPPVSRKAICLACYIICQLVEANLFQKNS